MEKDRHLYVKEPLKDFTRNGTFSFQRTMLFLAQMESHSTNREINDFFLPLGLPITQSAFVQARGKFNAEAFPALFHRFNGKYKFRKKQFGLHLLAIDGSDLNIPADKKDCSTFISYNSNQGGYHQMHINLMYDLMEQRYSDVVIQPRTEIREVIRAKEISSVVSPFSFIPVPEDAEFDLPVRFLVTRNPKLWKKNPSLYKLIHNGRDFDLIGPGDRESIYELSFRLIKIQLGNGSYEYLVTNLPVSKFPPRVMKELYHLRWGIEVSFLFLKYGIALNYFHSVKREFLIQEIYARLILSNFISLVAACAKLPYTGTAYRYKISYSDAIYKCRGFLIGHKAYADVLSLLLRDKVPIRPNRSYPRNMRSQRLKTLQHRS